MISWNGLHQGVKLAQTKGREKADDLVPLLYKENLKEADVPLYLNESKQMIACRITTRHNRFEILQCI